VLDLVPAYSGDLNTGLASSRLVATRVDSSAGSITLKGSQELFTDATLIGVAGGPSAKGGSLSVSSGRFYPLGASPNPLDVALNVTQSGLTVPSPFYPSGQTAIGNVVMNSSGNVIPGLGYVTADRINAGGFDSVALQGVAQFSGPVTMNAKRSLTLGGSGVLFADSRSI